MKSRKSNEYSSGMASEEGDSPFAALAGMYPDKPGVEQTSPTNTMASEGLGKDLAVSPVFAVTRTRKGGYPVFLEKRANHQVTVIRNISGDAEELMRVLKRRLGAGGVARGDCVELQGDHREKVIRLLSEEKSKSV